METPAGALLRGREDVCSGFRAAGLLGSALALLFHAVGTVALVSPGCCGTSKKSTEISGAGPSVGRDSPGGCPQATKL